MNESWNPEIPLDLQQNFKKEKEQAFTLYLDFVVDATASMYTVFPAVYYAAAHFLECLSKYEVYPQIGLTLIRNEENGEETETVLFEGRDSFTSDISLFLKKLKGTKLYGGGDDGKEARAAHRRAERLRRGRHARGGAGGRRQTGWLHARLCAHRDHVFAAACDEASLRDGCVRLHRHVRQPARGSDDRQERPVEERQRIYRNGEKEPQQVRRGHHRYRQHDSCAHAAVCRALRLEAAFHPLPQRGGDF